MYHKILISKIYNDIFTISFKSFTNQILFLKDRFNLVNLNYIDKKENSFSVTFDDGYDDLYYLVSLLLKNIK